MKEIIFIISQYGVDVAVLALLTNFSTGIVKIPIKAITNRFGLGNQLNKYITLIPLLFGFLYSGIYHLYMYGSFLNDSTAVLATTVASLSLAIYAIMEKFFQQSKSTEVKARQQATDSVSEEATDAKIKPTNIILGNKNEATTKEN